MPVSQALDGMLEGHWVEGALNGFRPTGAGHNIKVVDYTFFSQKLVNGIPVIQQVMINPSGYGHWYTGRQEAILLTPGRTPQEVAYSPQQLQEILAKHRIPFLPEFRAAFEGA